MPGWSAADLIAADISPTATRCALAFQVLTERGESPTIPTIMHMLGMSRSAVYAARLELDDHFPGWRETISENGSWPPSQIPDGSAIEESRIPDELLPLPVPLDPAVPVWAQALSTTYSASIGQRSWDLYRTYEQAWDLLLEAPIPDRQLVGECIALTANYVETMRGEALTPGETRMVAMLARSHGKAALYGFSKALGVTEGETMRDWLRYARAVAQRTVEAHDRKRRGEA